MQVTLKRTRACEVEITWIESKTGKASTRESRYFVMSKLEDDRELNPYMNDFYLSLSFPFEYAQIKTTLCTCSQ
jgi:hypothetical protein